MPWRWLTTLVVLGALGAACSDQPGPGGDGVDEDGAGSTESASADDEGEADSAASTGEENLQVAVSSYDLAVGEDQRFTAGLLLEDQRVLVGGEAQMDLFYLGEDEGEQIDTVVAAFLPVPGLEPVPVPPEPQPADGQEAGVYETWFDFDRPGLYGVGVRVELDDETLVGTGTFEVAEETAIVDVGEPAPIEPNPTLDDDADPAMIDSRARGDGEVPDPHLHQTRLEDSLEAENRALVLISTPVYCVSRFCGPITEQVADLAEDLPDDVDVIHIEVWQDFDDQQLHPAAEAWISTEEDTTEPWLFAVDSDGTVIGRWDNVADLDAARDLLGG